MFLKAMQIKFINNVSLFFIYNLDLKKKPCPEIALNKSAYSLTAVIYTISYPYPDYDGDKTS